MPQQYVHPADSILDYAINQVAHLSSRPPSVTVLLHSDYFDFLLQAQHWMSKGYFLSEESLLERDSDGSCCGVILYRPLALTAQ